MLSSPHAWPAILASFLLVTALPVAPRPESSEATYRSTVAEVRLRFFVTDERKQPITSLRQGDFAVVDNELVIRNFRAFSRADAAKLNVVVLVDASESVAPLIRQELSHVLHLLEAERLSTDHVTIISLRGVQPEVICVDNCVRAWVADRLLAPPAAAATPLFDGVQLAADLLAHHEDSDAGPVVILFSDGEDTISKKSVSDVIASLLAADAQIYAVDVKGATNRAPGSITLQTLAAATGGRYVPARDGVLNLLSAILEDLHTAFIVSYEVPRRTAGHHAVRILPTQNPKLQFRCRSGYYYDPTKAREKEL
jgi:Mg-chelatase subunit ChlD